MALSDTRPDFESIKSQLQAILVGNDETWRDLQSSATGDILIDFVANVGSLLHFNLERAVQEVAGFETALLDESVYALSLMLGVSPKRKVSATTLATLSMPDPLAGQVTIPARTRFEVNNVPFYNTSDVVFITGTTSVANVGLEQGLLTIESQTGDGTAFQERIFSKDFEANENFMFITVDGVEYLRERNSLFQYDVGDVPFLEKTLPNGQIRIVFPDQFHGTVPANSSLISFTYAVSIGDDGNTATSSLTVSMIDTVPSAFGDLNVTGLTTDSITGGRERESADLLRFTSPRLFAAGNRAITRQDWRVVSTQFTEVEIKDANIQAEFELFNNENTRMNRVEVTLLPATGTVLTGQQKIDYQTFMDDFKHVSTEIELADAVNKDVSVVANVFYISGIDPNALENAIDTALSSLYERTIGSLGRTTYLSEVYDTIQSVSGVDYVNLTSPTANLILARNEFANLTSTTLVLAPTDR